MPRVTSKSLAQERFREGGWQRIGNAEWAALRQHISEAMIRTVAEEMGVSIDQPWAGVTTKTLDECDSSLITMAEVYVSEPDLRRVCRDAVIASKDRARFAALNPKTDPDKRRIKEEMVERMLVWLGDPAMFATWVALRNRVTH